MLLTQRCPSTKRIRNANLPHGVASPTEDHTLSVFLSNRAQEPAVEEVSVVQTVDEWKPTEDPEHHLFDADCQESVDITAVNAPLLRKVRSYCIQSTVTAFVLAGMANILLNLEFRACVAYLFGTIGLGLTVCVALHRDAYLAGRNQPPAG